LARRSACSRAVRRDARFWTRLLRFRELTGGEATSPE
jgi:hypothetical protein